MRAGYAKNKAYATELVNSFFPIFNLCIWYLEMHDFITISGVGDAKNKASAPELAPQHVQRFHLRKMHL